MWIYQNQEITEIDPKYRAFVYITECIVTGKRYIGKKRLQFVRTRQVKGKKKKFKIESDWKEYYGSSPRLLEDIEKYGKDNFRREILYLCSTLGESSYLEAKEQLTRGVLESEDWYNDWIQLKVSRSHLPKKS
jgi:hypothetical protein